MPTRFLIVPQWQGSSSSRAMQLMDGAAAVAGDLPASATTTVDVPMEAGESLGSGVNRLSSISMIRDRAAAALTELSAIGDGLIVTIGGDCAADLASVQHAVSRRPSGSVALVWFDAHGDLNTAESSPSAAFHGMVLRALLGEAPDPLASVGDAVLAPHSVVLAGTRELDDGEAAYVDEAGIRLVTIEELHTPDALVDAVVATGADSVYVHVDLDVLDPGAMSGVQFPEPFGLQPEEVVAAITALRGRFELAGAAITEFAPRTPDAASDDLTVILRILGALTRRMPDDGAPS
ncbi:arginase family protein [Planctomonas sp. JC2975]|uniref:arginase family protein n=1 Tax=Planctomonas sp. JC2975 TaxID=2729626 RepID=UPI001475D0AB|nr:arginase family protein [Planctomonas sp. JC2975]NNC13164.1 arginase family protein [Planctomonas sp. JC2975]